MGIPYARKKRTVDQVVERHDFEAGAFAEVEKIGAEPLGLVVIGLAAPAAEVLHVKIAQGFEVAAP